MKNDGTDMKRLAELRALRRQAAGSMSYLNEMYAAYKKVYEYKEKLVNAAVKKVMTVLKANGIVVTDIALDLTPRSGFADVVLKVALAKGQDPIGRWDFRDKINDLLDHGWTSTWEGSEGKIEFEFPTR